MGDYSRDIISRLVGESGTNLNTTPSDPFLEQRFLDIMNEPLGSIPSIVFWNQEQLKTINDLETQSHIAIRGDYGTGKTILLDSFAKKLIDMGKEVIIISALDFEFKKNEEVLDIIFRDRYADQSFLSIADLRKDAVESGTKMSTNQLITNFVQEKAKNGLKPCIFIDEWYIAYKDLDLLNDCEKSAFEETLKCLKKNCEKAVVVLSSSHVTHAEFGNDLAKLSNILNSSGFNDVRLSNVMRNTAAISNIANDPDWNPHFRHFSKEPILGQSSTITGQKPTAILYNENCFGSVDHEVLGKCVKLYIEKNPHTLKTRLAILCYNEVSPGQLNRILKELIGLPIKCFDAGIDFFYDKDKPKYSEIKKYSSIDIVKSWFAEGGILLTHNRMFYGCEAESVILVSGMEWNNKEPNARSGPTRGVANLCIITRKHYVWTEKRTDNVHILHLE